MDDPLLDLVHDIQKEVETSGMHVFYGYLSDESGIPTVHWNSDHGGDWRKFLGWARAIEARTIYMNWTPFELLQIDDLVERFEARPDQDRKQLVTETHIFRSRVGATCCIDLAFLANGVIHIYQQTSDWFDQFSELAESVDQDDEEIGRRKPVTKAVVNKWASALAADPNYSTSRQREYLLEKLAGNEFPNLPLYETLRRAETVFQAEFRQVADEKLSGEIKQLREAGLNLNAIAIKLGISRDRVSGLLSIAK